MFKTLNSKKARLYILMAATIVAGIALMSMKDAGDVVSGAGFLMFMEVIMISGYMLCSDARESGWANQLRPPEPSGGLFPHIPTSRRRFVLYLALWVVMYCGSGWVMFHGFADSPAEVVALDRAIGAGLFVMLMLTHVGETMSVIMVRRFGSTPPKRVVLAYVLIYAIVGMGLGTWVAFRLAVWLEAETSQAWVELMLVPPAEVALFAIGVWVRDVHVTQWKRRVAEQAARAERAEMGRKLAEAQLAMMQAQIEPHFLYNTLASVQYLVRHDSRAADFLLTQLIRYLRHAMPRLRQTMSTLEQEFELADAYLQIARLRMGGRLSVTVELPAALHEVPFPPLILQTLVENALKHGVEPKPGDARIEVSAERRDGVVLLQVTDNGVGLGATKATAGSGTGLPNIRERLQGIYGDLASLSVVGNPAGGVTSIVALRLACESLSRTLSEGSTE